MENQPKTAAQGTQMLRRSDVRQILFKMRNRYLENMRQAEREDNPEWRFNAVQKLRSVNEMQDHIENACPIFINATELPAEARIKHGQTNQDTTPNGESHD